MVGIYRIIDEGLLLSLQNSGYPYAFCLLFLMDNTGMLFDSLIEEFGNSQLCWKDKLIECTALLTNLSTTLLPPCGLLREDGSSVIPVRRYFMFRQLCFVECIELL